jgi:hypothetical protein
MSEVFIKAASARKDYEIDWEPWLKGDTITSSVWIVPAGLTQYASDSFTDNSATIWLEGGTSGEEYEVFNRITTAAARKEQQMLKFRIVG